MKVFPLLLFGPYKSIHTWASMVNVAVVFLRSCLVVTIALRESVC